MLAIASDRGQDKTQRITGGREQRVRRWEVKGVSTGKEDMAMVEGDGPLLESTLCLVLDHFTYLQGTQGNQKKVLMTIDPNTFKKRLTSMEYM